MIHLKRPAEVERIRAAGRIVARALREMQQAIVPGKTTPLDLDAIAVRIIAESGGVPSFLGYRDYPAATCISVNNQVVHGIPNAIPLQEGDIVGMDLGVCLDGWHADSASTCPVGTVSPIAQKLLNVTREALYQGVAKARVGARVGDISAAIQRYVESQGFTVVRDLVGHGIGRQVHEEPSIPNFGKAGKGPFLKEGMTICIEPMVNQGDWRVKTLEDDWTMVTADGGLSAHFEHTVAITRAGPDILTLESG